MPSVTDFDPKGTISEVRVHAGVYLDILHADRSPITVTPEMHRWISKLTRLQILHEEIFDHYGKRKGNFVQIKCFK